MLTLTKRYLASQTPHSVKAFNPITKLQHVRLDLSHLCADNMLPVLRQNIKNRKAIYADIDRVHTLYAQFRTLNTEMEQLRQKRNAHAQVVKQIVLMEDDHAREKKMGQHQKVGKDYKRQLQEREKLAIEVEHELVQEALRLPNRTHLDSPVGDET